MKRLLKLMVRVALTLAGLLAVLALTLAAFGIPIGSGMELMAEGAFGNLFALSRTAVKATPLLLTGLGMVVAWKAGMYNIGGEGQFLVGAVFSAVLGKALATGALQLAPAVAIPLLLTLSVLGGALWAALAGWLYVKRGVDVVISTILLNFVAIQLMAWAVSGPLREKTGAVPVTDVLGQEFMLPRVSRQMDAHAGGLIAILAAIAVAIYLYRTKAGFQLRLAGESPRVARANRIDSNKMRMQAMLISGALCGLAGGVEYISLARQLGLGFSQNFGFLGIPVALLSGLDPILAIGSALFFGALFAGSENLARFTTSGPTLIYIVQAAAVLAFVAIRTFMSRRAIQDAPETKPTA